MRTLGITASLTRSGNSRRRVKPVTAEKYVSIAGVAEPKTNLAPVILARIRAISLA